MSLKIPKDLLKYISLTSGNISPDSPYASVDLMVHSNENIKYIISEVSEIVYGLPGVPQDKLDKVLTVDFIRDIMRNSKRKLIDPPTLHTDPRQNDVYKINKANTYLIHQLAFILSQQDSHYDPETCKYDYKWGYDVSSYKDGWKPGDIIFNNPINRSNQYYNPIQIQMNWGQKFTGLSYGKWPGDREYEPGDLRLYSAYDQTLPGYKYYSKAYDYQTSKVYPPSNYLSNDRRLYAKRDQGYDGCGNEDSRVYNRKLSTIPELQRKPHYTWERYNYIHPRVFFPKFGTI